VRSPRSQRTSWSWSCEPSTHAAVGVDVYGREQPLQLALRPAAARALLAAAGPGGAAGVSARRLLDALRPGLVSQELVPAQLWDIDTPDQLIAWRLRSAPAVSSILDLAIERQAERPVVIAIDGPSCAGKSILATALGLRSEGSVLEGDDFYRHTLPRLTATQRETMSDAAVVAAVIDWERLRAEALLPLRAGQSATFQPYDWDANDGRLAPPKIIPAAAVIIVDGVYAARPNWLIWSMLPSSSASILRSAPSGMPNGTPMSRIGGGSGSAVRRITSAPSVLPRALTFAWTSKIYAMEAMCKCSQSPYRVEM
jgi:hypothetical protein